LREWIRKTFCLVEKQHRKPKKKIPRGKLNIKGKKEIKMGNSSQKKNKNFFTSGSRSETTPQTFVLSCFFVFLRKNKFKNSQN